MPKRSKNKPKTNRINLKRVFVIAGILVVLSAVAAQIAFNMMLRNDLNNLATVQMRTMIVDAIDGLIDQKDALSENRLPESRLIFPPASETLGNVRYSHSPADDDWPGVIEITTLELAQSGIGQLNATNMLELFESIPEAQACSRGFAINFEDVGDNFVNQDTQSLSGTVELTDGRTLYIWREKACTQSGMDELEAYLLQAKSY